MVFRLTQEETLSLSPGCAEAQIRYIDANGIAQATGKAPLQVMESLLKEVIVYDEGDDQG